MEYTETHWSCWAIESLLNAPTVPMVLTVLEFVRPKGVTTATTSVSESAILAIIQQGSAPNIVILTVMVSVLYYYRYPNRILVCEALLWGDPQCHIAGKFGIHVYDFWPAVNRYGWNSVPRNEARICLDQCFLADITQQRLKWYRPLSGTFIIWGWEVDVGGEGPIFKYVRTKLESKFLASQHE